MADINLTNVIMAYRFTVGHNWHQCANLFYGALALDAQKHSLLFTSMLWATAVV